MSNLDNALTLVETLSPLEKVKLIEKLSESLEQDLQTQKPRRSLYGIFSVTTQVACLFPPIPNPFPQNEGKGVSFSSLPTCGGGIIEWGLSSYFFPILDRLPRQKKLMKLGAKCGAISPETTFNDRRRR